MDLICKYCLHSDNEEDRGRSSHNGQSVKEFKDEETVTTKSVHIVQATETTATRKRGAPSKKVDLGAAAHYTGDKSPDTTTTTTKQVGKTCSNMQNKSWCMHVCRQCPDQISSLFQSQPTAPQPTSTGLADLLMVDVAPSQTSASGMSLWHFRKYALLSY